MNGLQLDLSMSRDRFDAMQETYRNEGLSVGANHMRWYGEDIQLEVSFDDLILGNRIGQGACSSVNIARHKRTGEVYAIKMFNVYDKAQASQLYNEISMLANFQCDALITLKGAFHDEGSIGVIIEYMDRGSLEFILDKRVEIDERAMAGITFQILWGLGYLHYEKQIHRDVKPGNILMNSLGQVKLSDFGISKDLDTTGAMSNTAVGSYRYMSPERLRGETYDAAGDIWSVGISIIELWEKAYPFRDIADTPISLLGELEKVSFSRLLSRSPVGYSKQMKEFLLLTLEPEAGRRPGAADLMSARWFEALGVTSLPDAQSAVAHWLSTQNRGQLGQSTHSLPRGVPAVNAAGRPPRKDANEMSISMESSRSSLGPPQQFRPIGLQAPSDELGISREVSRERTGLSNNPFTSSGSFNFNSASFSGTGSMTSSSGGVAALHHQHQAGSGYHHGSHAGGHGGHGASSAAASRYRMMAQDIGRGSVPEGDEYAGEEFEVDDEEEVVRYEDTSFHAAGSKGQQSHAGRGGDSKDYKYEEKRSADSYYPASRGHK